MSDRRNLSGQEAVLLLRKVVFEKGPEYVYPPDIMERFGSCQNFLDEQPSCVVGHVLHALGLDLETATGLNISGGIAAEAVTRDLNEHPFGWHFSREATNVLTSAQNLQDMGAPWGVALEYAERSLDERCVFLLAEPWHPDVEVDRN